MASNKPALYLHIGVHRTGTTSIQAYLQRNQKHFLDSGVLIPFGQGRPYRHSLKIRSGLSSSSSVGKEILADLERRDKVAAKVLFSDEDISQTVDPEIFSGLSEHFDVKVVIFLRRQDQWLESWFQQNIKAQWDPELAHIGYDEFFRLAQDNKFFWIDYQVLANNWSQVFGRENLLLRVMDRSEMPEGPVHEFLRVTGCDGLYDPERDVHKNASFSPRVSEFIRHLPLDKPKRKELKRVVLKAGREVSENMDDKGMSILSPSQRQEILERYSDSNRHVAQEYFGREKLFDENVSKPYIAWPELASDESIRLLNEVAGPLVLNLSRESRKWRKKKVQVSQRLHYSKRYHLRTLVRLLLGLEK